MSIEPADMQDRREQTAPAWRRFNRRGDVLRNPIVIGVAIVLLSNVLWAAGVCAWQQGIDATHEYWRRYGASIAAEAGKTDDPHRLREIIARVQAARSP